MSIQDINKIPLRDWVKHPTTIMLLVAVNLIWILIVFIVNSSSDSKEDCQKELDNYRAMLREKDQIINDYTKTILFKDAQIKNRESALDSAKNQMEVER